MTNNLSKCAIAAQLPVVSAASVLPLFAKLHIVAAMWRFGERCERG